MCLVANVCIQYCRPNGIYMPCNIRLNLLSHGKKEQKNETTTMLNRYDEGRIFTQIFVYWCFLLSNHFVDTHPLLLRLLFKALLALLCVAIDAVAAMLTVTEQKTRSIPECLHYLFAMLSFSCYVFFYKSFASSSHSLLIQQDSWFKMHRNRFLAASQIDL